MNQRLIPEEITRLHSEFRDISKDCRLSEDIIESYTESRDKGDGVYFDTEDMEGVAYSYIKALDIIKFVAKSGKSGQAITVLEILRPLRSVERVIGEYKATLKEFRWSMEEELRDAIEPYEELMIDVVNWVAGSMYNEGGETADGEENFEEDEEDF